MFIDCFFFFVFFFFSSRRRHTRCLSDWSSDVCSSDLAASVRRATARHADLLSALDDPLLAARAADVRQLGRRAARLLSGAPTFSPPRFPAIFVARDLGPADVAELELAGGRVRGIALAEGAGTSHVAIMARSLQLP